MLRTRVLPAGEYQPDQPDFANSVITAENVLPWKNGYKSFRDFSAISSALDARAQGAFIAKSVAGINHNFAGTVDKLYVLNAGTTYSDVTRVTTSGTAQPYTTPSDGWWDFAQFGDLCIATNGFDAVQAITLGSTTFAALGGSPPVAKNVSVVRDFVVLGNLAGTSLPNRVQWSGINNAVDWTPSLVTLSDYQDIPYGGGVQRIFGGEYGVVFLETAVVRMTFVGTPVIFQFDVIESNRGLISPMACAQWGNMIFFLAEDGFYAILGGKGAVPIGDGKVDSTFAADLDQGLRHLVNCEVDPATKIFYVHYPGEGNTGRANRILAYNWVEGKWAGPINWEGDMICRFRSPGYTLEDLDAFGTLDTLEFSLDSRAWAGGAQSLGGFNSAFRLGTFSGTAMSATVDVGEVELAPGRRAHVPYVRPLVDGVAASVTVRSRDRLADSISTGTAVAQNANGVCNVRAHARYQSYRITTSGNFDFIQGIEVAYDPGGIR